MTLGFRSFAAGAAAAGLLGVVILGAAVAAPAAAQEKALKIALIDVERLVKESLAGKEALAKLKKAQEEKVGEARSKQEEIDGLRKRLNDGRLSLAQDKLAEIEKQLEDKVIGFRRFQDDADRELGKQRETVFGDIERRVIPIIEQVGKEAGYTLILNKFQSGLVYADESIDITPTIIQRFDSATKGQ